METGSSKVGNFEIYVRDISTLGTVHDFSKRNCLASNEMCHQHSILGVDVEIGLIQ